ncbi:MAG: hypothetical protein ACTHJ3_10885 [Pararhizobium sp.]
MPFDIFLGVVFVACTVALTLGAFLAMRVATGGDPDARDRDLTSSVIFRISALHGLILALVFAQEMFEYQQLRFDSASEANAIADVYYDAGRYNGDTMAVIQKAIHSYLDVVVSDEWRALGTSGQLSSEAWKQWDIAYQGILDMTPENGRQASLRDHMLAQIHQISEMRVRREEHAVSSVSGMFWFAAISGVILIALAYYSFPAELHNFMLLGMFGAFTGIILFFIYSFSNPYRPPGTLQPEPYIKLQAEIAQSLRGG